MDRFAVEHKPGGDPTEVTREVVTSYFRALMEGDNEAIGRLASPDMKEWVLGDFWWSGLHDVEESRVVRESWIGGLKNGGADLKVELLSILADGNRASVEARYTATWGDGRPYDALSHLALDVSDGMVVAFREYFDTAYEAQFRQAERRAD